MSAYKLNVRDLGRVRHLLKKPQWRKTASEHALTRKRYQSLPQISLSTSNKQQMSQADTFLFSAECSVLVLFFCPLLIKCGGIGVSHH